jgi:hypothetical protein
VDVRSPKKKKSGGGGKRKRKEGDDGDGAYPAKKGRGDVSLGVDAVVAEEKEGRSTRSRKRRDSSGSDGTSTVTRSAHES